MQVIDRSVFDITAISGDEKILSIYGKNAKIVVPYTLGSGENENAIVVFRCTNF